LLVNVLIIFKGSFYRKKREEYVSKDLYIAEPLMYILFYSTIKKCLLFTKNIIGTVFACIKFKEGELYVRNLYS